MMALARNQSKSLITLENSMTDYLSEPANKITETIIVENKLGTFEFAPERLIYFPNGIIGFAEFGVFGLTTLPDSHDNAFYLLQSVENASLSFIVYPTTADNAMLDAADVEALQHQYGIAAEQLVLIHLVTIRHQFNKRVVSINVRAPLVLDVGKQAAVQHVLLNDKYSLQHVIAER